MSKVKLSKKAEFILREIAIVTHPDTEFIKWVANPDKNVNMQESELLEKGLVYEDKSGDLYLTKLGRDYVTGNTSDVDEVIRQIKNVLPKNPSFDHIAQNLTDTALVRAIYSLLGEIGRRGDPEDPKAWALWCEKLADLEKVVTGADPSALWARHQLGQKAIVDAFTK